MRRLWWPVVADRRGRESSSAPWHRRRPYRGWGIGDLELAAPRRSLWTSGVLPPAAALELVDWLCQS